MNNENLLPEDNRVPDYLERLLQMMQPYKIENGDNFYPWLDFFEYATDMIGVPNDKIIEIFNSMIDDYVHMNVQIFYPFLILSELSYDSLINRYLYYFHRMERPEMHMTRFKNRNRYEAEPIERYASNLQKIFEKCDRGSETDKTLNKRFIEGLKDDKLKTYIKRNMFLSFEDTVKKVILVSQTLHEYICECKMAPIIYTYRHGNTKIFCAWLNSFEFVEDFRNTPDECMLENFNCLIDIHFKTRIQNHYKEINFSELSYDDTVNLYLRYYISSDEPNVHRKRFYYRKQYELESIDGYAERLQKIYNKCDFNDSLEEILSEQFVNGLCKKNIKKNFKLWYKVLFVDVVSFAIKCEKSAETINYETPDLSIIDSYNPENEGTFWDWLNKFEYKVKNLKLGYLTVLEIFNKKIPNDVQEKVKKANPNIEFCEISYKDTIRLYLRYFASVDETDVYRRLFLCRNQYEQEKVTEYADDLCDIFAKCSSTGNRDKLLIDKFINGIYDNEIKNILRKFSRLNFRQLIELAHNLGRFQKSNSYLSLALCRMKIFHPDNEEEFYVWLNKFEYIADLLDLENKEIISFFNFIVHDYVHKLVKKANSSRDLPSLRYNKLINCYLRFYDSANETDLHLKRFLCRNQYEKETLCKYFSMLITLYKKTNTSNFSTEKLCERFREGVIDDKLKIYLNNCHGLTSIVTLAMAFAFANENSQS